MTTRRPSDGEAPDPDRALSDVIGVAVNHAPEPAEWGEVVRRSTAANHRDSRRRVRWPVLVGAAALVVLAGSGGLFVLTRPDPQSIRTNDSAVTNPLQPTTIADDPSVTTAPGPQDAVNDSVEVSLPALADSPTEVWSTTIDGGYPQSAVRIGDTLVFGQQDLPGVRAVDARTGNVLWSFTLDDDPATTVVNLRVMGDYAVVSWMDAAANQLVTALDVDGADVWNEAFATTAGGPVIRYPSSAERNSIELLAADGSVQRSIDDVSIFSTPENQVVVLSDEGLSWYRMRDLEQIAGPIPLAPLPAATVAVGDDVITVEGTGLRFLDQTGELRAELEIGPASALEAIEGERPGVVVAVPDDPQPDVGGRLEGTTTFYELIDDTITPVWTRHGFFEELIHVDGRSYVVHTDTGPDVNDPAQHVINPATGDIVVSGDVYDTPGAADGFVFAEIADGANDIETVAYDLNGDEKWRLQLEGRERAEIVNDGVLVGLPDTVAQTVDLTFYVDSDPDRVGPATNPPPAQTGEPDSTMSTTDPTALAEGRSGGPLRDQGCDWSLLPLTDRHGVSLRQVRQGGTSTSNVYADGTDDVVWVNQAVFCADGPTVAIGGARDDVTRVVVENPAGDQVELDFFDVPGEPWRAVMGELPQSWRVHSPLDIEVIALNDASVLEREQYET